ncbi:MAG: hypothetical protein V1874_17585 [Spirochaetota bacterium]
MASDPKTTNGKKNQHNSEKTLSEKKELLEKLKKSLINSGKNARDKKEIEFLLRRF